MSKFDRGILDFLSTRNKFDSRVASVLKEGEKIDALVRVRNPLHFGMLERNFEITHAYPFISTVGIKCGLKEAILLEKMQEVEYVSSQSRVFALDFDGGVKTSRVNDECDENSVSTAEVDNSGKISGKDEGIGDKRKELPSSGSNNGFEAGKRIRSDTVDKTEENCVNVEKVDFLQTGVNVGELDGRGVTMCVLDTGISPHLDLSVPKERIVHFVDMIGNETEPYDDNGHGTFVTGVAIGNGLTSAGEIRGVAPMANVVGVKVIGKSGESGAYKILDGMQWLFDNFRRYDIRVACMSFGAEPLAYADPLKIGAEMLARSGIIVVCASGNSGENGIKSPAISREVIAVGAVDKEGNIANFSSRGVYQGVYRPDVYANGVDVISTRVGGTYSTMSGTSASAPYVAGACCLLCQKYRNITPNQAKNIILNSSIVKNQIRIFT